MRVVLADVKSPYGLVNKDTVVGGYGSRLLPFSRVTSVMATMKKWFIYTPSVQMAYIAAILARAGHDVLWSRGELVDGDVALVLSSIVDYRNETAWADRMRARGVKVGFVGIAASKLPELFRAHADFVVNGEPEAAALRIAAGYIPSGVVTSEAVTDLDSLPFPRWDLLTVGRQQRTGISWSSRPMGGGRFPILASRGCPEFCTYCPHRILAGYRFRSISNIVEEIAQLCDRHPRPYVVFRDPLFSEKRDRMLELCDAIQTRGLHIHFDAETRLDRLDTYVLEQLHAAGLRAMGFGVESLSPTTLKRAGRRPIPESHQRNVIEQCRRLGIVTAAFYVLGFLQDDWESIAATIDYAIDLGSTFAQFKVLTPYPGTPMFKQLEPLMTETDWEKFDGFTPTFRHPALTSRELKFLLGRAYQRFYVRPSYLANLLKIQNTTVRDWVGRMDQRVNAVHAREEIADISRAVTC